MSLVSVEEVEAFMGREFTTPEAAQAQAVIDMVEAIVGSEVAGVSFTLVEDDIIDIQADGHGIIELSSRPVHEVSSILDINGDEVRYWDFDGLTTIYNLFPLQVVQLTYTHGYETLPADIRAVIIGASSRFMNNPSGLRQETVGAISVTYPGIQGESGTIMFSSMERNILAKYASQSRSLRLKTMRRRTAGMPILTLTNDID